MTTATTTAEVRSSHLRAFALPAHGRTQRVALVPEQAVLLAGDRVTVSVRVGAGRSLEVVEPGGTVAYAMRGQAARWDVRVEVDPGGCLVWRGEPFVVSEGAAVARSLELDVAAGARVLLRETLVLGRTGERPGVLVSRSDVRRDGVPVLVEELDSRVGLGGHRVVDQVLELGPPTDAAPSDDAMVLESGDRLRRWLGAATHLSPLGASPTRQSSSPREE